MIVWPSIVILLTVDESLKEPRQQLQQRDTLGQQRLAQHPRLAPYVAQQRVKSSLTATRQQLAQHLKLALVAQQQVQLLDTVTLLTPTIQQITLVHVVVALMLKL